MKDKITLTLTCSPTEAEAAQESGAAVALTAYGIWRGHLYRYDLPKCPFEVMCIDAERFTADGPHSTLASEIIREAVLRACRGILLDMPQKPTARLCDFCSLLSAAAEMNGLTLYLPEHFAARDARASALVRTALCAGSLRARLSEAVSRFGCDRVALDIGMMSVLFPLPGKSGAGRTLSRDERSALCAEHVFFSEELCEKYSSVRSVGTRSLILFDDGETVEKKLVLAAEFGIGAAFAPFAEICT